MRSQPSPKSVKEPSIILGPNREVLPPWAQPHLLRSEKSVEVAQRAAAGISDVVIDIASKAQALLAMPKCHVSNCPGFPYLLLFAFVSARVAIGA